MFWKVLFKIGQYLRNPSLDERFMFLKQAESWSLEKLEAYQLNQLIELLSVAYHHSSFYFNAFTNAGIVPEDIKSLDDLKRLPCISKKELIAFNKEIHTKKEFKKKFSCSTSGTSGESLQFQREEKADSFNRAAIFRGYSWYHVKPWERNGYFWGFNFGGISKLKTKLLDWLQNRFRLFSYKDDELKSFVTKLQNSAYLHGYASMVYGVAKYINEHQISKPKQLKMVKGTSEKIQESYQSEIQKAFGMKMISEYGAAETGIIAFECPKGNMHINMEGVLVEEENNEIIVTNLQMHSFPIIRYRLGDYITLAPKEKKCSCGLHHPILEEVNGRKGAMVVGKTQDYPSLYFYYIFKNIGLKGLNFTYQVQQHQKGELLFLIEQKISSAEINILRKEIERYFQHDVTYQIQDNQKICSEKKKSQSFISTIN
ncbi:phenylacetate--CoA ligase family protein [Lutibacter holmesii]|uniref:Phenylacetate--CoA ligase family protein n=1 Tax=Lutibacter holmesii TaxID=1137985 RepID=A0ABW3WPB2_9FLAO